MIFRRKRSAEQEPVEPAPETPDEPAPETPDEPVRDPGRADGPWDEAERNLEDDTERIDFGGLVVTPRAGLDVRAQADARTGQAIAVLLVDESSALELRAFATPTDGQIWDEVRAEIVAETEKQGHKTEEADGPYGIELLLERKVELPDGKAGIQPSRIVGIEGPRWFLRATFLGRLAREEDREALLWQALRDLVVRRGAGPMAPRQAIPLTLPEGTVLNPEQQQP